MKFTQLVHIHSTRAYSLGSFERIGEFTRIVDIFSTRCIFTRLVRVGGGGHEVAEPLSSEYATRMTGSGLAFQMKVPETFSLVFSSLGGGLNQSTNQSTTHSLIHSLTQAIDQPRPGCVGSGGRRGRWESPTMALHI